MAYLLLIRPLLHGEDGVQSKYIPSPCPFPSFNALQTLTWEIRSCIVVMLWFEIPKGWLLNMFWTDIDFSEIEVTPKDNTKETWEWPPRSHRAFPYSESPPWLCTPVSQQHIIRALPHKAERSIAFLPLCFFNIPNRVSLRSGLSIRVFK